jgi:uncharacterized protein YmfQ (DUF2313 family)
MGVKVQTLEQYAASLRKLFPQGPYWDQQFADINSDCSLFCKAKLDEFVRFRNRMSDLQDESAIQSALETLEEWERILTGSSAIGLTTEQRRMRLIASKIGVVSKTTIKEMGQMYGLNITDIQFPFRSSFFGFSRFGTDRIACPAAFSVLFIYAAEQTDNEIRIVFENQISRLLLADYIIYFIYGDA